MFNIARIGALIDILSPCPLPRRHRRRSAGERKIALKRFTGLRFLARQGKRRDEIDMRGALVRNDLDRTAGPFDRLVILFQCEMAARLVRVP